MVDTFTDNLRLRKPEVGANENLWAPPVSGGLNDGVVNLLDRALAGIDNIDVTAGNVLLVASNGVVDTQRPMFLRAIGTPGVARDITVPDPPTQKMYVIENQSDGIVTFKTVSGTGTPINIGQRVLLYVDSVLDEVFPITFAGNIVFEAPAFVTGTVDIANATAGDTTLTYRFSFQGNQTMFQLPEFSSTITPGAAFSSIQLNPNTPASLLGLDMTPFFVQSFPIYIQEAGTVVPWYFRTQATNGSVNSFLLTRADTSGTVPNGTVITLPHNITLTWNNQGF